MSISVGGSSGSQSYLQLLQQQSTFGSNASANTSDLLSGLLPPTSSSGVNLDSANPTPPTGGTTSSGGQQLGACTMDELLKMQGQGSTGSANSGDQQSGACDMSELLKMQGQGASGSANSGDQQSGACDMNELLKMQDQSASGGTVQPLSQLLPQIDTGANGSTIGPTPYADGTDGGTSIDPPSNQSSPIQLDQLMQLQSQMVALAPPIALAIV